MRKTEKKSNRFAVLIPAAVLIALLCFSAAGLLIQTSLSRANAENAAAESIPQIGVYQGEGNRYYYSGDFTGGGTLYYMLYSNAHGLWQGDKENSRVYVGNGVQTAAEGSESIRATVLSKTGKMTLTGSIDISEKTPGEACKVGIALLRGADSAECEWILPMQKITKESGSLSISGIDQEGIDIAVNDILLYVVGYETGLCGAVFNIEPQYKSVTVSEVPTEYLTADNIPVTGNLTYDAAGNAMNDVNNVFKTAMATDNKGTESLLYVYQAAGVTTLTPMDFAGWEQPGFWYTMPNTYNSVGVVWQNKFYSNLGMGYSGLLFTAPADGLLSVYGATARSSAVEVGDDKANIGQATEYARWDLYRVTGEQFTLICGDTIVPDTMKEIGAVEGTQNIAVTAGSRIFLRYDCSAPWKTSCITPAFRFVSAPSAEFTGWEVSGNISEAEYAEACAPTQGENHWYHAFGGSDEYYLMENEGGAYTGKDMFSEVGVKGNEFSVSASSAVLRIYKAVGSGEAVFTGNVTLSQFADDATELTLYKRAYTDGEWGEPELLQKETLNNAKMQAEFQRTLALDNGDLLLAVLRFTGVETGGTVVKAVCNLHVAFTVSEEGDEVVGVGEVTQTLKSDWYGAEQGKDGWFYAYGAPDNYVLMEYGFGIVNYARWYGPEWNNAIESGKQLPSAYSGALCIFVADRSGEFTVTGAATLLKTDGLEGVIAAVYHNGGSVWEHNYTADERSAQTLSLTLNVGKGDVVQFYVANNKGKTVAYATEFSFNIAYKLTSQSEDIATPAEMRGYLSDKKSYAEYVGIADNVNPDNEVTIGEASGNDKKCGSQLQANILPVATGLIFAVALLIVTRIFVKGRKDNV